MKKFVNLRLPVIIACSLALGTAIGNVFKLNNIDLVWLTAIIPLAAIIIIISTAVTKNFKGLIFVIFAVVFIFAGFINCFARLYNFENHSVNITENKSIVVYGTVKEKRTYSGGEYIIVKNATVDGKKLDGNIIVYLGETYGDYCDNGYKVRFYSALSVNDLFPFGTLNRNAENNIKYTSFVNGGLKSTYRFSFFGDIRAAIRDTLFDNLDYDTASVCYGMLIGETGYIEENALESFRYGGVAHIFAVSGLHIGLVYGLLSFICRKTRINKYVSAALCITAVFLYSGVCGFTVSSIRAAIMCAVSALSKLIYAKNDGLNSLSLAVTIILLITPLSLFSAGFQLSVCAVGGIIIFSKPIAKCFGKIKVPEKLIEKLPDNKFRKIVVKIKLPNRVCSAFATSFAAQTGTLPIMLATFGYISGAGLLLNIIIIPILSAFFTILFICTVLCAIISPAAAFIMPVAATPLDAVISFLLNAGFEKALISGFGAGLFIPLYFLGMLAVTDKLNLKMLTRLTAVVCSAVICATYVFTSSTVPVNSYRISASAYRGGGDVIITSPQGTVLIVTDYINSSYILSDLNKFYSTDLDAIIFLGDETSVMQYRTLNVDCDNIYIFEENPHLQPYVNTIAHYETYFSVCGINFRFNDGYTVSAECGGVNICVAAAENLTVDKCDLLFSIYEQKNCDCPQKIYFSLSGWDYNIYDYGDITFNIKNGVLKKTYYI